MAGRQYEQLTPEEFDRWIPIRQAVELVAEHTSEAGVAEDFLTGRIRSGTIAMAVGKMVLFSEGGTGESHNRIVVRGVSWAGRADNRFWSIGDHTVHVAQDSTGYSGSRVATEIHGARLDPSELGQLLRELGAPVRANPIPPDPSVTLARYGYATIGDVEDDHPEITPPAATVPKKPVSDATLRAWWTMCLTMRPAAQWDFPAMQTFFGQCFPNKSVSRDRLREARGKQKSGPKAKAAE